MSKHRTAALLTCVSAIALMSSASYGEVDFEEIEDLPGSDWEVYPYDMSGDGLIVVGESLATSDYEAYMWTMSGGTVGLGDLPGGSIYSSANGVSNDGSVIVGNSSSTSGNEAFVWTQAGGMVGLGDLAGGVFSSTAEAVNVDGSVVVGFGQSASGPEAFRWTDAGGMVGLGHLPGASIRSRAVGVSHDGSVVVGSNGKAGGENEAFRWTQAGGMVGLGDLVGGDYYSVATDVSADGIVVVGLSISSDGREAFRWTQASGMVGLGDLPGGVFKSHANAISADGAVIIGYANSDTGYEAARWTEANGWESIADLLTDKGVNLGDWDLSEASAISDDGKIIAGYGTTSTTDYAAWWAVVDIGFISVEDFYGSLGALNDASGVAQASAQSSLDQVMNVARYWWKAKKTSASTSSGNASIPWSSLRFASNDMAGLSLSDAADAGQKSIWAIGGSSFYDADTTEADDLIGSFGISHQQTKDLRFGVGVHIGESDLSISGDEGNDSNRSTFGLDGYISWEPQDSPLRLYVGATTTALDDTIVRSYLNGVDPATSEGQRDGNASGGFLVAGWSAPAGQKGNIMPFVGYEATRIILDGYSETTGPFAADFDKIAHTSQIVRLGADLSFPARDNLDVWGSLAWAHRFDEALPGISGHIAQLASDFSFGDVQTNQNWTEVKGGFNAQIRKNLSLHASFSAALDDEDDPQYGGMVGLNWRL